MQGTRGALCLLVPLALVACTGGGPGPAREIRPEEMIVTFPALPEQAGDGACWSSEVTPAKTRLITEEVVLEPPGLAPDGTLREEPLTRTQTREEVVSPRVEIWFEGLCAGELTADRIQALQRALALRGLYSGRVSGALDGATGAALQRYQSPRGLDSTIPSRAALRQMGLVTVPSPDA